METVRLKVYPAQKVFPFRYGWKSVPPYSGKRAQSVGAGVEKTMRAGFAARRTQITDH